MILVLSKSKTRSMDFSLKVLEEESWNNYIKENAGKEWKVDCDLDSYIEMTDQLEPDELKNIEDFLLFQKEYQSLQKASEIFPALAFDLNGNPLMFAWANMEAVSLTIQKSLGTYYSRSRKRLWTKGETSGHFQEIRDIKFSKKPFYVIYIAKQIGAACHTGFYSCFFREIDAKMQMRDLHIRKVDSVS